jgi:hypothetical protein
VGATTSIRSENEIGFDLCLKNMELIISSLPHQKPLVKQQVPPKTRPLAAALVSADSSEYSD